MTINSDSTEIDIYSVLTEQEVADIRKSYFDQTGDRSEEGHERVVQQAASIRTEHHYLNLAIRGLVGLSLTDDGMLAFHIHGGTVDTNRMDA